MAKAILVVDDDDAIREAVTELLTWEGFSAISAANGQDALDQLSANSLSIGLMIVDLSMPKMDGRTFLNHKLTHAALTAYRDVPAMVFSAVAEQTQIPGVSAVVKKPVDVDSFLRLVRDHYRG